MINLNWVKKGKEKATWEEKNERKQAIKPSEGTMRLPDKPQASVVKGVVLYSKCQCLSEVFRNYEVSEKAEDKEVKMLKWVEVRPPQLSHHSSSKQGWREKSRNSIPLVTKKDSA
ncbi:hypothetical protein ACFX1T_012569 [Malus domestica]